MHCRYASYTVLSRTFPEEIRFTQKQHKNNNRNFKGTYTVPRSEYEHTMYVYTQTKRSVLCSVILRLHAPYVQDTYTDISYINVTCHTVYYDVHVYVCYMHNYTQV